MTSAPERPGPVTGPNAASALEQAALSAASPSGLQVIVKQETPFLPKVAFVLISLASLAGVTFTGAMAGLGPGAIAARWLGLWAIALAGGFAAWRVLYLRRSDREAEQGALEALNATALARARTIGRRVAPIALAGVAGPLATGYLAPTPLVRWALVACLVALAAALAAGVDRRPAGIAVCLLAVAAIALWAYADAGAGWHGWMRAAHLAAFTLWLGGALWNIAVAMPAGRAHANVDAVVAGAHQLDRFRWVVRFALPTIIVTGLLMAGAYRALPATWWAAFPGALIPGKVLAIIALVVVFITCPLFRHCSPVQGVCDLHDLEDPEDPADPEDPEDRAHPEPPASAAGRAERTAP
ncbi:hypothetical protein [Pseudactinotalea sp. HY160]|uniref:hypothetical protein n=1 Tax=Pseudactinotalea sp. HY160 TaxID=2654490 RepID=UPI001883EB44|nr:hypothetical protein [Pseudactinotalea sp. HY160]